MKKTLIFFLLPLLFACNQSSGNDTMNNTWKTTIKQPKHEALTNLDSPKTGSFDTSKKSADSTDMKVLFSLTPLSIFDETTEGLSLTEKKDLLEKGESATWEIMEEGKTKLLIRCKYPFSEVTFYFFQNKDNQDGVLFAQIVNERYTNTHSWRYFNEEKKLEKASPLKTYTANDFLSQEDRLPDSYQAVFNYEFIDDQTIEVSLQTWMEEAFENREIINRVFLKWNGENFEEQIVKNE